MRMGRYGEAAPPASAAVVALRKRAETDQIRIRNQRQVAVAEAESEGKATWAKWAPLIIVGGVLAVGAIAWALKRRSAR